MKHIKLFENFDSKITLEYLTDNLTSINLEKIIKLMNVSEYSEIFINIYIKNKSNKRRSEELYNLTNIEGLVGDWKFPFGGNITNNEYLQT